jgi:RNA polymerase sigma-70 factor (ECF subfamily)
MEALAASPGPGAEGREEDALLARARAGDQDAYRVLVDAHRDRAYALALRILRSAADAEEVAQDAFVRAWLALPRFRGDARFSTWLYRIVARRAFDRAAVLKSRRARETAIDEAQHLATGESGAEAASRAAIALRLERLMDELSPAQRAAVTLYYYEGRSVEQAAAVLGMPENTVKTHLSRARATLRAAWLREGGT